MAKSVNSNDFFLLNLSGFFSLVAFTYLPTWFLQ